MPGIAYPELTLNPPVSTTFLGSLEVLMRENDGGSVTLEAFFWRKMPSRGCRHSRDRKARSAEGQNFAANLVRASPI